MFSHRKKKRKNVSYRENAEMWNNTHTKRTALGGNWLGVKSMVRCMVLKKEVILNECVAKDTPAQ